MKSGPRTFLQFASVKTPSAALEALREVRLDYADVIGTDKIGVYKVTLANGTWYRVVVELSQKDAAAACSAVKARGGDCIVVTFIPS